MAKISRKPPVPPATKINDHELETCFNEDMDNAGFFSHPEPITQIPNVDVFSSNAALVIEVELPGVRKEDIGITLQKNTLTIKAVKFECFNEEKINYVCMERTFGRIFRAIEFPFPVDTVKIRAVFKDGMLTITIPRVEDKRNKSRSVPIEGA